MFSFKETGFVIVAVILWFIGRTVAKTLLPDAEMALHIFAGLVLALPALLFGFFKPYGYALKDYIKDVWWVNNTTPKEKRWESDFNEDDLIDEKENDLLKD